MDNLAKDERISEAMMQSAELVTAELVRRGCTEDQIEAFYLLGYLVAAQSDYIVLRGTGYEPADAIKAVFGWFSFEVDRVKRLY